MSYIDANYDKDKDLVRVVERINGERVFREYPVNYTFYYDDPRGKHRTIYGTPVTKVTTNNNKEFQKEIRIHGHKKIRYRDIKPVNRCLEDNYLGADPPKLHTAFFDIETDFDKERGFAPITDPFSKITAI